MIRNLTFAVCGLGQKKYGIEKTVEELYAVYNNNNKIIQSELGKKKNKLNKLNNLIINHYVSNTNNLEENLKKLFEKNCEILSKNQPNINIGGDHSIAISTVGSTLKIFGSDIKVIWIDAHADINTTLSSPTGNVHGMPLSFLTGLDTSNKSYNFTSNLLNFKNLCYIGIRDFDTEEKNIIEKYNIKKILSEDFNSNIYTISDDIISWISNSKIHLSIDVDSLDPKYIQCTGTKVSNGLDLDKLIFFINKLKTNVQIVNSDISELNLYIDYDTNNDSRHYSLKNHNLILKSLL